MKKLFLIILIITLLFNIYGCTAKKEEKKEEMVTYFFDMPDMAFIKEMTLIENYEFDKPELSENGWEKRSDHSKRRQGWWNSDTITFNENTAVFDVSYKENGMEGIYSDGDKKIESPAGFYCGAICSKRKDFKYGYFEARIKMPDLKGFWGAFWLTCPNLYQPTGVTGAEIDVVEAMYIPFNSVSSAIHYNYGDLKSEVKLAKPETDIYSNFLTYGLLWDEDSYKFYINGVKVRETDFGGVSQAEEYIILSLECGDYISNDIQSKSSMVVDYVRVYQFNKYLQSN